MIGKLPCPWSEYKRSLWHEIEKEHGYQAHVDEHKSSKAYKGENIKHNSKRSLHKKGMFRKTESGITLIKGDCYVCKILAIRY